MNLETARQLKAELRALVPQVGLFRKYPLFAVGIGLTPEKGRYRLAIRLRYRKDANILKSATFVTILGRAGADLDIKVTGRVRVKKALPLRALGAGPLRIGSSISHKKGTAGTLGFFARTPGASPGPLGVVSCNHIIANFDGGVQGDEIISPAVDDGGYDAVAELSGTYPILDDGKTKVVDCAFAVIKDGIASDPKSLGWDGDLNPAPVTVTNQLKVRKLGRTTDRTTGIVTVAELDGVAVYYGILTIITFDDVIQIAPDVAGSSFADGGDSGSLVYSDANQPVGLLFAESATGGALKQGYAYANPIAHVMKELGVQPVTS